MAAVWGRISDAGTDEFPPPSRKRRYQIYAGNADTDRRKVQLQSTAHLEANMRAFLGSPTTPNGTPLLERLLQLEQHMDVFDEQRLSPRSGLNAAEYFRSPSTPCTTSFFDSPIYTPSSFDQTRCRSAKSVLLETKVKGTLVERIQRLENLISQHGVELEKALSSPGWRFESPSRCESDHMREDREHSLDQSSNSWSEAQETYATNLEVPPRPGPALLPQKSGGQLAEDAATVELHIEREANPASTRASPTAEAQADADSPVLAEAAGKRSDENAARESKSEGIAPASDQTSTDSAQVIGQVVLPENASPQLMENETEGKQGFKHIRERIQEFFGLKETDSAAPKGTGSRTHKDHGSKESSDSATKAVTPRRPATKAPTSRLHGFGSKETDSAIKATSRLHRFGSDTPTKASTSRLHRFGSKEINSAAKPSTSRPHRLGSATL